MQKKKKSSAKTVAVGSGVVTGKILEERTESYGNARITYRRVRVKNPNYVGAQDALKTAKKKDKDIWCDCPSMVGRKKTEKKEVKEDKKTEDKKTEGKVKEVKNSEKGVDGKK